MSDDKKNSIGSVPLSRPLPPQVRWPQGVVWNEETEQWTIVSFGC